MQLSISPSHTLLDTLPHKHKFILSSIIDENAACLCDYKALPLPSGILDSVLLHHVLDFSPEPHRLLKESARIVSAGGYIIIVGFNPFSLFGFSKWLAGLLTRQEVWRHNSLRRARLIDWLQLIGFQLVACETGRFGGLTDKQSQLRLPQLALEWLRRRISTGAFYVVVARKQTTPLNPTRHAVWQAVKTPGFAGLKTIRQGDKGD
ncbi:MAG: class I SAM-dependent methyltransferase [Porticoccaceae bacterium]|nr:class I SAM-dependent methyltransferase [Porticoccaceae bacterium]